MNADTLRDVMRIMKRGKSEGVTAAVILATALYELDQDLKRIEGQLRNLDTRTIGMQRIG
jgi:hypothetical protein